jgi:hypothetical protein
MACAINAGGIPQICQQEYNFEIDKRVSSPA